MWQEESASNSRIAHRFLDTALAPNGRWLAYTQDAGGHGREPLWSRDGRTLFYRQGQSLMAAPFGMKTGLPRLKVVRR